MQGMARLERLSKVLAGAVIAFWASAASVASAAPPIARIAFPTPVVAGEAMTLDGSPSTTDVGGYVDSYSWDLDNDGAFDADGETVYYTFDAPGTYPVRLAIIDDKGQTGEATVQVRVVDSAQLRRAQLTWDTATDVDLHIWDGQGQHTYFQDQGAIPAARLVEDIIPGYGPEYFEDRSLPWSRSFTYGLCMYNGDHAHANVILTDPDGSTHVHAADLGATGDFVIVANSPLTSSPFPPAPGWCRDRTERVPAKGLPSPAPYPRSQVFAYVALGDSYSAGEGVDPYFRDGFDRSAGRQTGQLDNRCHRATRAYAEGVRSPGFTSSLYALTSSGSPGTGKHVNKYGSDANVRVSGRGSWAFLACSGATTENVLPRSAGGRTRYADQVTQIDNPVLNARTTLVTITIGGNDVGFADVIEHCLWHSCNTPAYRKKLSKAVIVTAPDLTATYSSIRVKAPNARVLVLGYPQLFPASHKEQKCQLLRPWRGEQTMLRAKEATLNSVIKRKAAAAGFGFIDIAEAFAGHEVCGKKGAWINGPSSTYKPNRLFLNDESFHPTVLGQAAMAGAVNRALR